MPLAPAIAASLSAGLPARSKGLYIDGLDVLKQPGAAGNLYGVEIGSIELIEAGPGDVSTLAFAIDDPLGVIALGAGQIVRYMDITRGVPLFLGFLDSYTSTPLGLGRQLRVTCIGIEVALDWIYVPAFTVTSIFVDVNGIIAGAVAAAPGIGISLNFAHATGASTQAAPLGLFEQESLTVPLVIPAGTLRAFIGSVIDTVNGQQVEASGAAYPTGDWRVTVDFYGGVRAWDASGLWTGVRPADWALVTLAAGTAFPDTNLEHTIGVGDAVRNVYVNGGNAAGSGMVSDGSGLVGPTAVIDDSTCLTAGAKRSIAAAYFDKHGQTVRGDVGADELYDIGSLGAERHAGSTLRLTDAQVGLAAYDVPIASITKTFIGSGTEVWELTYGSLDASGAKYLRRLTAGSVI